MSDMESSRTLVREYAGAPYGGTAAATPRRRAAPYVVASVGLLFLTVGIGPNAALATGSLLVLAIIIGLLWRPGEPPILLYLFIFQWLEASVWIFYANLQDVRIDDGSRISEGRLEATILLLIGLAVQVIGVRYGMGRSDGRVREIARAQVARISQKWWLELYIKGTLLALAADYLARLLPLLSQPLLALVYLRWAAYVMFTMATFSRRDASKLLWGLVFLVELASSVGGYFSSFKFVFVFTFIGVAASQLRVSNRVKLGLVALSAVAILFGSVWSAIKVDYRTFVNGGLEAQVVMVEYAERLRKLAELTSQLGWQDVKDGFGTLVERIEYVEYFGYVTTYVPDFTPHTNGRLWLDAIERPLMPRLIFRSKPAIDESFMTNRFTGLSVAGVQQGTQISLGYMAETFIDFGRYLTMPVLLFWGIFLGRVYRSLVAGKYSRGMLGIGLASATLVMACGTIGNSIAKLVGGLVVCLLVNWLFYRFVVPRWLRWLSV